MLPFIVVLEKVKLGLRTVGADVGDDDYVKNDSSD
jgi:hypothetical protein